MSYACFLFHKKLHGHSAKCWVLLSSKSNKFYLLNQDFKQQDGGDVIAQLGKRGSFYKACL